MPRSSIRIPDGVTDVEAAASAHRLRHRLAHAGHASAGCGPGETVLVNSVGSGIGSAAVQVARHAGAFVIGNSSRDDKLARAAALGLDDGHQLHDPGRRRRGAAASPAGVASTSSTSTSAESCSRRGSTRSPRTAASSSAAATPARSSPSTSSRSSGASSRSSARSSSTAAEVATCFGAHSARGASSRRSLPPSQLEQAKEAMELMESRDFFGKIVLTTRRCSMKRVGVDVGGTFTDLIYVDDEAGTIQVHKLPTTPDDPSLGTIQGIRELAERPAPTRPSSTRSSTGRRSRRTS